MEHDEILGMREILALQVEVGRFHPQKNGICLHTKESISRPTIRQQTENPSGDPSDFQAESSSSKENQVQIHPVQSAIQDDCPSGGNSTYLFLQLIPSGSAGTHALSSYYRACNAHAGSQCNRQFRIDNHHPMGHRQQAGWS